MLLFITTAGDATANLLFEKCNLPAFRLNIDLWQEYSVVLKPDRWEISNPAGLRITSESATHCFWWKAFNVPLEGDRYLVSEIRYLFRELYGSFRRRGLVVGNPPDFHNDLGKMQILRLASRHFSTPESLAGWNLPAQTPFSSSEIIAKSFSGELTDTGKVLVTTPVTYARIDRKFPWFLQTRVEAHDDVTVFVCGDRQFAFGRSRKDLQGLDWRTTIAELQGPEQSGWRQRPLSSDEAEAIRALCRDLGVEWGRFDFLEDDEGLVFLEFNANGQWAFLDFFGDHGIVQAVAAYLTTPPAARGQEGPERRSA
jgi:hypothetical protein